VFFFFEEHRMATPPEAGDQEQRFILLNNMGDVRAWCNLWGGSPSIEDARAEAELLRSGCEHRRFTRCAKNKARQMPSLGLSNQKSLRGQRGRC
jgi:hypothetical protein